MAKESITSIFDKDIRALQPSEKKYLKVVGNPKELNVRVNPTGVKRFFLKYGGKEIPLKEFRAGIYSVADARRDANKILSELENGKDIQAIRGDNKYLYKNLLETYLKQQRAKNTADYMDKVERNQNLYILPKLGNVDVKSIKQSDLYELLTPIFNKNNPTNSRLETIRRLIQVIKGVLEIAHDDRYIEYNPAEGLKKRFPTSARLKAEHGISPHYPALTEPSELAELFKDIKADGTKDLQTIRAVWLHILTANRPENTAEAKWADIDLNNGIWTIFTADMKMRKEHKIGLSSYAIAVLKQQYLYSCNSVFVFPSITTKTGHISKESINDSIKNMGYKNKYHGKVVAHGFRATFKTLCTMNGSELLKMGIDEKIVESCLAHTEKNQVVRAYERNIPIDTKRELMQWYAEHLNSIEPLGIEIN